jgi:hypothetical protein
MIENLKTHLREAPLDLTHTIETIKEIGTVVNTLNL